MSKIRFMGSLTCFGGRNTRKSVHGLSGTHKVCWAVYAVPFLILVVILSVIANPWHTTRWGGDTGEQTYTEQPIINDTEDPEENPYLCCSSYISVVSVTLTYGLFRWKRE